MTPTTNAHGDARTRALERDEEARTRLYHPRGEPAPTVAARGRHFAVPRARAVVVAGLGVLVAGVSAFATLLAAPNRTSTSQDEPMTTPDSHVPVRAAPASTHPVPPARPALTTSVTPVEAARLLAGGDATAARAAYQALHDAYPEEAAFDAILSCLERAARARCGNRRAEGEPCAE